MQPWGLVAAAFSVLAVDAIAGAALAAPSLQECLEKATPSLLGASVKESFRSASPPASYDSVLVDARGVVWRPHKRVQGIGVARYTVAFNGTESCWLGGKIVGTGTSSQTAPSAMAVATEHATDETALYLLDITGTLNGIWIGRQTFDLKLGDILFSNIKDTCIVADHRGDLLVNKVFLQNCARVIKWLRQSAGSTLTIRNSLIRINNRPNVRTKGRLFNPNVLASAASVYFERNVVATAAALNPRDLSIIAGNCSRNTLIWLGNGDYPGDLPGCFTVVKGQKAWRNIREAWVNQRKTRLAELGKDTGPGESICVIPPVPDAIAPKKTVGRGSPASCTESALRGALSGGGTIAFSCGPSPASIPIGAELVISSPTVIDGGGTVTLDGQNRTRIIRNDSQLTLNRITLTRGRQDVVWNGSPNGGGAVNTTYGNRLYVVDSTFTDNWTSAQGFGGAIFQAGAGALTVVRSRFENNVGGGGGAIYNLLAGLRVVDSAFIGNQGSSGWQGGGGIMTDGASAGSGNGGSGGEILVCGSTFKGNQALATGGGAYLYAYAKDAVTVTHSTFTGNSVTPNSGGVSMGGGLRFGASPALVSDSTFRNNTASMGGAIATEGKAQTQVKRSTFQCNSSDVQGGKVLSEGNTTLKC